MSQILFIEFDRKSNVTDPTDTVPNVIEPTDPEPNFIEPTDTEPNEFLRLTLALLGTKSIDDYIYCQSKGFLTSLMLR
jgi:hypothetical protein